MTDERPGWVSSLRRLLYSKWFFGLLALVCVTDLVADVGERVWGWTDLNLVSIALDVTAAGLSVWIFADLHRRRPRNGNDTRR